MMYLTSDEAARYMQLKGAVFGAFEVVVRRKKTREIDTPYFQVVNSKTMGVSEMTRPEIARESGEKYDHVRSLVKQLTNGTKDMVKVGHYFVSLLPEEFDEE
jgi:endonuclease V-like protein UPF0215 family